MENVQIKYYGKENIVLVRVCLLAKNNIILSK